MSSAGTAASAYTHGYVEQIGGHYVSIALPALDDLSPAELVSD
jgi:hypothetical protein